jgi:CRISPR/Cas system-associated protein Cas10 (large subunit of type III CRISPR-Cas system)
MSNLRALAIIVYKEYDPIEREANIEQTFLQGLLTMTADRTKAELEQALMEKKRRKEKIVWKDLLEGVIIRRDIWHAKSDFVL